MTSSSSPRHRDYDCAQAILTGVLKPHREKEGEWVLCHQRGILPVGLHQSLREDLEVSPEKYRQPQRLLCWVRWDWEKSRLSLTVVQPLRQKESHRDHYNIRGRVVSVQNTLLLVQVTPAGGVVEPFEIPVVLNPNWKSLPSEGQRVDLIGHRYQGWLHARQCHVLKPLLSAQSELVVAS